MLKKMENTTWDNGKEERKKWWSEKRLKYNLGLIISGFLAFIAYSLVVQYVIPPAPDVEITLFTIIFQGIAYLIMMGIANVFYNIGQFSEKIIKPKNVDGFRKWTFNIGFWISCFLPFSIPIILLVYYL
ncbi:hypothetical protein Q2T41_06850 [Maribacter confluentis]|uniref:Uncharacterized protein n=1 Tax=Maribacter confluentis TaxID=1656093 RepID=A0ABT8RQI0_9FLAO|nr:hypothetical protein [Maribacter confluentis]MDO1512371.1 hypothetical protein [Maribacter confluentis]